MPLTLPTTYRDITTYSNVAGLTGHFHILPNNAPPPQKKTPQPPKQTQPAKQKPCSINFQKPSSVPRTRLQPLSRVAALVQLLSSYAEAKMAAERSLRMEVGGWSSVCIWVITHLGMLNLNVQVTASVQGTLTCSYVVTWFY